MRQLNTQSIQLRESLRRFGSAPEEAGIGKAVDNLLAKIQRDASLHHGETDNKRKRPDFIANLGHVPLHQLLRFGNVSATVTPFRADFTTFGFTTPLTPRPQETSRRSQAWVKYYLLLFQ